MWPPKNAAHLITCPDGAYSCFHEQLLPHATGRGPLNESIDIGVWGFQQFVKRACRLTSQCTPAPQSYSHAGASQFLAIRSNVTIGGQLVEVDDPRKNSWGEFTREELLTVWTPRTQCCNEDKCNSAGRRIWSVWGSALVVGVAFWL